MNRIRNKLFKDLKDKDSLKNRYIKEKCSTKKEFIYNEKLPKKKQNLKTKTPSYNKVEDYSKSIPNKTKNFNKIVNYNDIYNLIKTMKKPKNIIYTFTSIDEPLLKDSNDDFETEMFGKINKKDIKEIQILSLLDENKLESELEKLYLNEGDKIIVFRFHQKKTALINYINYVIENFFKKINYEENRNKKKSIYFFSSYEYNI